MPLSSDIVWTSGTSPEGGPTSVNFDQDLGNIQLIVGTQVLDEVVVKGEVSVVTLALDRKIYRVDRDAVATGGTAEDALRNVPSLSVDLDGNLSLRNGSPQVFVDGRPTTLSLDQIAADAIESVEVITNPSAKYDASGGQAGIVNIVLKKEKRIGYNGNLRLGTDSRGGLNAGGDVNAREGKINAFFNGNFNQRRSYGESETRRENFFGAPPTNLLQNGESNNRGFFAMARGGVDWLIDNRNTLTLTGSLVRGQFQPEDVIRIHIDSLHPQGFSFSDALRSSETERNFRNLGGSVLFKHLFPKAGKEWTADLNYNRVSMGNEGDFSTQYLQSGWQSQERQLGDGSSAFYTLQTDFVNPLTDKIKLEIGMDLMN